MSSRHCEGDSVEAWPAMAGAGVPTENAPSESATAARAVARAFRRRAEVANRSVIRGLDGPGTFLVGPLPRGNPLFQEAHLTAEPTRSLGKLVDVDARSQCGATVIPPIPFDTVRILPKGLVDQSPDERALDRIDAQRDTPRGRDLEANRGERVEGVWRVSPQEELR